MLEEALKNKVAELRNIEQSNAQLLNSIENRDATIGDVLAHCKTLATQHNDALEQTQQAESTLRN